MKDNRLTQSDIDKVRRRLDLLLKDCARYMMKENPEYRATQCEICLANRKFSRNIGEFCNEALCQEGKLIILLRGVGIFDTGTHPPSCLKKLVKSRGRVRMYPAPNVINNPLTRKEKNI